MQRIAQMLCGCIWRAPLDSVRRFRHAVLTVSDNFPADFCVCSDVASLPQLESEWLKRQIGSQEGQVSNSNYR